MDGAQILMYLESISVRAAGLWAVAAIVLFLFRVRSASTRHAVWTLVAGAMLLLPVLQPSTPPVPLRLLAAPPVTHYSSLPLTIPAAVPVPTSRSVRWEDVASGVWIAGALLMLGRVGYGLLFARRIVRSAAEVEAGVWESEQIAAPVTIGSRVVLPANWREWSAEKRNAVLAHERAHVLRHDWAIVAMASVNRAVFWFHPVAWWLERSLRTLAEDACDDAALAEIGSPDSYASVLVEIAGQVKTGPGRVLWETVSMARGGEVSMRVERILNEARELSRYVSWRRWAVMGLGALPVVWFASAMHLARVQAAPMPAVTAVAADQQPETPNQDTRKTAQENVRTTESEIFRFKQENMRQLPEQFQLTVSELQAIQMKLSDANVQLSSLQQQKAELEARLERINAQSYSQHQVFPEALVLREHLRKLEADLNNRQETLTASHPEVKLLQSQLAVLNAQLAQAGQRSQVVAAETEQNALRAALDKLSIEVDQKISFIQRLNQSIARLNARIERFPKLEQMYAQVQRDHQKALEELERASTTGPSLLSRIEPEYTAAARSAGIQGKVELSVTIGTDGIARDIQVIRSLDPGLDKQAIDCVAKWRFRPAERSGQPVTSFATVEVNFKL